MSSFNKQGFSKDFMVQTLKVGDKVWYYGEERYLDNIKAAQSKLDLAEEALANLEESLKYFENLKKELFAEVEA